MQEKLKILKQKWAALLEDPKHQKTRIKDAADILNVSEAELLSTTIGKNSFFLDVQNWGGFFKQITQLGPMMYLVRNDYVVHENKMLVNNIELDSNNIILSNAKSIITINQDLIKYAIYTSSMIRGAEVYSIHLFDINGIAIIKIYLKNECLKDFEAIKNQYKIEYNFELQTIGSPNTANLNEEILAINEVQNFSIQQYLEKISKNNIEIQIKVSNKVASSIYKGTINNVIHKFGWLNIMDPDFNLHAKDKEINKISINDANNTHIQCFYNQLKVLEIINDRKN